MVTELGHYSGNAQRYAGINHNPLVHGRGRGPYALPQ